MISAFQSSAAVASGDSSGQPEIVHFDATNRRKDKMRHQAGQERLDAVAVPAKNEKEPQRAAVRTAAPGLSRPQTTTREVVPVAKPAAPPAQRQPIQRQPVTGNSAPTSKPSPKLPEAVVPAVEKPVSKSASANTPVSPAKLNINIAELEAVLVNFVVEQTGYPAEMVELDADLEADLGIDSIKKAQMLGELAEQLDVQINITEDMSLDDFPTLRHITEFLRKAANDTAVPAVNTSAPTAVKKSQEQEKPPVKQPTQAAAPVAVKSVEKTVQAASNAAPEKPARTTATAVSKLNSADLQLLLVNFVVEQTGYPPEMVELDADLEADLGIDSIKKAQLFGELAEQLNIQIEITEEMSLDDFPTLRHVLQALESASAGSNSGGQTPATETPTSAKAEEPRTPAASHAMPVATQAATPLAKSTAAATNAVQELNDSAKLSVASLKPEELEAFLVNFVVEQTGYPPEMVELDADLEADLGIDSIKKAQLFGELAENLDVQIQITEEMSLDDYRTLRDVLNLLAQDQK